ncbi:MAG: OmpA family protein, partial [Verrucomicrobiales bacterium]
LQLKGSLEERLAELVQLERSLTEQAKKNELQATTQAELEGALAKTLGTHRLLEEKVAKLMAEKSGLEEKIVAQRAEALRERILRKRVETQLEDMAEAQAAAAAEEPEPPALTAAENAAWVATNATDTALLEIAPIYFAKNHADSEAQERSLLAQLREIHQRFPAARFSISGHTCTDGSSAGNLALSERRAQRIADLIKNNGIPAAAIAGVVGKGEASPIADNNTQQGREANRRVEIKVLRE